MRIVIDPGHGGKDPGAIGPTGLKEKDVTLTIALRLQRELARHGVDLTMTRTTDTEVNPLAINDSEELQARCDIANKAKGDYFVSIHCNSYTDPKSRGTETWILARGGKAEGLAKNVHGEVVAAQGAVDRGIKTKAFYVLKNTNMPSILVENLFISNPAEEKLLRDNTFLVKTAQAMTKGILAYAGMEYIDAPLPDGDAETEKLKNEIQKLQKQVENLTTQLNQALAENSKLKEIIKRINTMSTLQAP
ncbi:MAG: N-acetylmuramoyl-L-alanine amidase family protein [Bacillota bacterium]